MRDAAGGKCELTGTPTTLDTSTVNTTVHRHVEVRYLRDISSAGSLTGEVVTGNASRGRPVLVATSHRATNQNERNGDFCSPTNAKVCVDLILRPGTSLRGTMATAATTSITIYGTVRQLASVGPGVG